MGSGCRRHSSASRRPRTSKEWIKTRMPADTGQSSPCRPYPQAEALRPSTISRPIIPNAAAALPLRRRQRGRHSLIDLDEDA